MTRDRTPADADAAESVSEADRHGGDDYPHPRRLAWWAAYDEIDAEPPAEVDAAP